MFNKKLLILAIFFVSLLTVSVVSAADNATGDVVSVDDISDDIVYVNENNEVPLEEDDRENVVLSSFVEDTVSIDENDEILGASPPSTAYKVSVSNLTMDLGKYEEIPISITPTSSSRYDYKYDFYFKIYDSNDVQKVSERYYSTSSSKTEYFNMWGDTLRDPGIYTMKIINYADNNVMSTAKLTLRSVPYNKYKVSVSDITINQGSSGSIQMSITPATSGYYYTYDYYLKVYDSNNHEKISQRFCSVSSEWSKDYILVKDFLNPGIYTIKILNNVDNHVMDTAKLTIKAKTTYDAYSVNVVYASGSYGFGGKIDMSITPASSSYIYTYDFYLKVFDSNNRVKISERYYSTTNSYSKTYDIGGTELNSGSYTIKIINHADNNVMDTVKLNVKELIFQTNDVEGYCDEIIEYKVRVGEENNFKSGLNIIFTCDGKEYSTTTDNDGYASLKIHLKSGNYQIVTKFGSVVNVRNINVLQRYVADRFKNVKITSQNTVYNTNKIISYGWEGNLNGYLKIYKGKSLVYSKKLNTNGYTNDYFTYMVHSFSLSTKKLNSVGTFIVKILDSSGKTLASSSFKISKASTKTKCSSFKTKVSSKDPIYAYFCDGHGNYYGVNGKAKFKVMGKTYYAKVKNGNAKIKVKIPSKVKTYKCKVTFLSNKKFKGSSVKFKIHVKKAPATKKKSNSKKITLKFKNSKSSGKHVKGTYVYAAYGDIYGAHVITDSHNSLNSIKFIKAKVYFKNNYNGNIKVKTKKLNKWGMSKTNLISGYKPYKVVIFYK